MHTQLTARLCLYAVLLSSARAHCQNAPATPRRDQTWEVVSNVHVGVGSAAAMLMPRVYYSAPLSTVGWKARFHVSVLAPAMTLTALTWLIDAPIRDAVESPRPGCTVESTRLQSPGCETFGSPSSHAFASWSATGLGLGLFTVDTLRYSSGRFHAGAFFGNVVTPLTASLVASFARAASPGGSQAFESAEQVVAGAVPGFFTGLFVGIGYAMFQPPHCGYGNAIACW